MTSRHAPRLLLRVLAAAWLAAVVFPPGAASAQQRPLLTEDPRLIPEGEVVLENGVGYFERARFPVSGLEGRQLSVLSGGAHIGLGRAEFQMTGVLRNYLWITAGGEGTAADWGDGLLATKIGLVRESARLPDISFQTQVVLPNASRASGLGVDGTHFFGRLLLGRSVGSAYVFGNVGLGILDDAVRAGAQQDVLVYGAAAVVPVNARFDLAAEINGHQNPVSNPTPGGEDRAQVRVGLRWRALHMEWDLAATAGLTRFEPRAGLVFGTTKRFAMWR